MQNTCRAGGFLPTEEKLKSPDEIEGTRHHPFIRLESFEEHILQSSRLSRALWRALDGMRLDADFDERDYLALLELSSLVAHHASAAEHLFNHTPRGEL